MNLRGTPTQPEWKQRIEKGELLGPTIYTAAEFIDEPRGTTPEDVRREVSQQARDGYDLVKFHEVWIPGVGFTTARGLSRESCLALFQAARDARVPVVGHLSIWVLTPCSPPPAEPSLTLQSSIDSTFCCAEER